jgi:signal transduction histidine kinase
VTSGTTAIDKPAISRLSSEFLDRALEERFGQSVIPEWRRRAFVAVVVGAMAFFSFGIVDGIEFGWRGTFYAVIAVRAVSFLIAAAVAAALLTNRSANRFYWSLLLAQMSFVAIFCGIVVLVPQRTNVHVVGMIAMILIFYLFVPSRPLLCTVAGLVSSGAFVVAAALWTPLLVQHVLGIAIILGTVNAVGTVHVMRLHRLWRQSFAAHEAEKLTNERLKKRSRQLAKARDEANHANRAKSEFLAHMSHELRAPLNAINGFSEIIKDQLFGPLPDRYREYAADIHRSGMHLTALINDVLDLSKVEAGKLEVRDQTVSPADAVDSCLRLVRDRAFKAGLRLSTLLPDDTPPLRADDRLVKQILLNLLTNAIKFTPEGGEVRVVGRAEPGGGFVLAVEDTGIGIAAADLPRVVEPYVQVAAARDRNPDGTGLGLPLVKRMIELHGGAFRLASTPGAGTVASVLFPPERVLPAPCAAPLGLARAS